MAAIFQDGCRLADANATAVVSVQTDLCKCDV